MNALASFGDRVKECRCLACGVDVLERPLVDLYGEPDHYQCSRCGGTDIPAPKPNLFFRFVWWVTGIFER